MARKQVRPRPMQSVTLTPLQITCRACGCRMRMGHHSHRTVTTLQGAIRLTLKVYRCRNTECSRFHQPTRPEEEGAWALPHGEFGLDVIALVGILRYQQQRSILQIHEELQRRGLYVAERTVTNQLYRYEELLALHLADETRLCQQLKEHKQVILALDGLQPDVGHEVLWVQRDCCSGEVLLARSLLGATEKDLVPLLEEAANLCRTLSIPIKGVITDGQHSIRKAVASALPDIPHQLCHFHYLREAAKPIANADQRDVDTLRREYQQLLSTMTQQQKQLGTLAPAVAHFQKVTTSYWDGLFRCYQVNDLPRTNNDLEHFFGTARHVERRATGRKRASPTLVVRGSVGVVAAGASRILSVSAADLRLSNVTAWRALRQTLDYRQQGRRRQLRFRRDPQTYLTSLEERLCRSGLPS